MKYWRHKASSIFKFSFFEYEPAVCNDSGEIAYFQLEAVNADGAAAPEILRRQYRFVKKI